MRRTCLILRLSKRLCAPAQCSAAAQAAEVLTALADGHSACLPASCGVQPQALISLRHFRAAIDQQPQCRSVGAAAADLLHKHQRQQARSAPVACPCCPSFPQLPSGLDPGLAVLPASLWAEHWGQREGPPRGRDRGAAWQRRVWRCGALESRCSSACMAAAALPAAAAALHAAHAPGEADR